MDLIAAKTSVSVNCIEHNYLCPVTSLVKNKLGSCCMIFVSTGVLNTLANYWLKISHNVVGSLSKLPSAPVNVRMSVFNFDLFLTKV